MDLRILLVEDDPGEMELIRENLRDAGRRRVDLLWRQDLAEAEALLSTEDPGVDVVFLDLGLAESKGIETLLLFSHWLEKYPVIVLTGLDDEEVALQAMHMGAEDYLVKGYVNGPLIVRAACYARERHGLKSQLIETNRELDAYRKQLEVRVELEKKIRESQEQLLVQKSKMASMGEMIGAIAHQWRQPLNSIAVTIQDLKDGWDYGELDADYLARSSKTILDQVHYMSNTIEVFRKFASPARTMSQFDLCQALEDVFTLLGAQLRNNAIDVVLSGCPPLPPEMGGDGGGEETGGLRRIPGKSEGHPVFGSRMEFQQVIMNLIQNARDAVNARKKRDASFQGGRIAVSLDRSGDRLILRIEDNGGGIPEDIMDSLFEPYVTTKGDEGTGIGLVIAKSIVEKMGGTINAMNGEEGAVFVIQLLRHEGGDDSGSGR